MASWGAQHGEVYFGDARQPLPDWRQYADEHPEQDEDEREITAEEAAAIAAILGFDPDELDAETS